MFSKSETDKRRGHRLPPDREGTIKLRLPWYGGQRRETLCVLLDASAHGAGILINERLANGTKVSIEGDMEINAVKYRIAGTAEVVNSRMEDRGLYRIGLQFVEVTWERVAQQDAAHPADVAAAETEPDHDHAS